MLNITVRERKSLLAYFPSALFSENHIRIPNYMLPRSDYTHRSTELLIHMPVGAEPEVYVPSGLFCLKGGNHHLDFNTEPHMAARGWKKLCIRKRWTPEHGVMSVLNMINEFFMDLSKEAY